VLGAGIAILWFGYAVLYWGAAFISGRDLGFVTVAWRDRGQITQAPKKTAKGKG
jgi:hypothetical protein